MLLLARCCCCACQIRHSSWVVVLVTKSICRRQRLEEIPVDSVFIDFNDEFWERWRGAAPQGWPHELVGNRRQGRSRARCSSSCCCRFCRICCHIRLGSLHPCSRTRRNDEEVSACSVTDDGVFEGGYINVLTDLVWLNPSPEDQNHNSYQPTTAASSYLVCYRLAVLLVTVDAAFPSWNCILIRQRTGVLPLLGR